MRHEDALTPSDDKVYIAGTTQMSAEEIAYHEVVHAKEKAGDPAYDTYYNEIYNLSDKLGKGYSDVAQTINEKNFGGSLDIESIDSFPRIFREIAAYLHEMVIDIPQDARDFFSDMFGENWGQAVEAVQEFHRSIQDSSGSGGPMDSVQAMMQGVNAEGDGSDAQAAGRGARGAADADQGRANREGKEGAGGNGREGLLVKPGEALETGGRGLSSADSIRAMIQGVGAEADTWSDGSLAESADPDSVEGGSGAGKYKITDKLKAHIENIDVNVPRKRGIGGAHRKDVFMQNDIQIISETPISNINGVTTIEYQMPKLDRTGAPIPGEYQSGASKVKTIYDPNIISTDEYLDRGLQAANNAVSQYPDDILPREWVGVDNSGVTWRGYYENGEITSMYPEQ